MARIRTIKPEFWQDEKMAALPDYTRLIFLGLISLADDFGRLVDNPKLIEAQIFDGFANRSRDVRESLATLSDLGRICRGKTEAGQRVIQIVNWSKHQKVDKPNKLSALAEIVDTNEVSEPRELVANHSRLIRESFATPSRLIPTTNDQLSGINDQGSSTNEQPPYPPPGGGGSSPLPFPPPPNSGGGVTLLDDDEPSGFASSVSEAHRSSQSATAPPKTKAFSKSPDITDPNMLARQAEFAAALDFVVIDVPHDGARAAIRRYLDDSRTPPDRWQNHVGRFAGWTEGLSTTAMKPVSWEAIDEGLSELLDTNPPGQTMPPQTVLAFVEKAERRRTGFGVVVGKATEITQPIPPGMTALQVGDAIHYARKGAEEWIQLCRDKGIDFSLPSSTEAAS